MVKKLIIAGDRHRVVPDPPRRGLRRQEGPRADQAREDDVDNVDDVGNHDDVDDDDRGLTRHEKRFGITSFIYRARYLVAEYGIMFIRASCKNHFHFFDLSHTFFM